MKTSSEAPRDAGRLEGGVSDLDRLSRLIGAFTPHDGSFELRRKGVHAIRRSHTSAELVRGVQRSALCIVAKSVMLGQDLFEYDAARMIAFSVDLPVASRVTRASVAEPFLCLRIDLDPQLLAPSPSTRSSSASCAAPSARASRRSASWTRASTASKRPSLGCAPTSRARCGSRN